MFFLWHAFAIDGLCLQRSLQVYEEVHRLRDYYYDDYMQQLRIKIDKQREDIQRRSEEHENKMRLKEKSEV